MGDVLKLSRGYLGNIWGLSGGCLREEFPKKRMFTFGHCPNQGGGRPLPEFFGPIFTKL